VIFVEPDFKKYNAASDSIMKILRQYDPNLAPNSLDECFMNLVRLEPILLFDLIFGAWTEQNAFSLVYLSD
jgi:nucleotidyltransferase/DNA polymerase involved in DNA repair